jgi:hypothetical protein
MVPQLSMGSRYKYPKSRLHQSPYRVSTGSHGASPSSLPASAPCLQCCCHMAIIAIAPRVPCMPHHSAWRSWLLLPLCSCCSQLPTGSCTATLCVMQHCHSAEAAVHPVVVVLQFVRLQFLCSCCFAVCSKMWLRCVGCAALLSRSADAVYPEVVIALPVGLLLLFLTAAAAVYSVVVALLATDGCSYRSWAEVYFARW